jgi:hypothetical protein
MARVNATIAAQGAILVTGVGGMAWNTFGLGPLLSDAARRNLGFEPRVSIAEGAAQARIWVENRRDS